MKVYRRRRKVPKKKETKVVKTNGIKNVFLNLKDTILNWSFQQKIVAGVTAFAIVFGAVTTGIVLHNHKKPVEAPTAVVEPEVVEEVKVEGNKVEVPTFSQYTITTESMVQDLKIYFTDGTDKRISGVPFSVIMTSAKTLKSIDGFNDCVKVIDADTALINMLEESGLGGLEYTADLAERLDTFVAEHGGKIDGAEEELKGILTSGTVTDTVKMAGKSEKTSDTKKDTKADTKTETKTESTETTDATAESTEESTEGQTEFEALIASGKPLLNAETEQPLSIKEYYLVKKQNDIVAYQALLENVDGKVYNDDDSDGIIKITKIDGGDYIILCNPQNGYDTATYETKATVKAELEYKKVENIKKEVVKDAGDTQPAEAAPVEAKLTDTVAYFKSSKTSTYEYTPAAGQAITSSAGGAKSSEVVDTSAKLSVSGGSATLYAVNSAKSNSVDVTVTKTNGANAVSFSDVAFTKTDGINVTAGSDGKYTISVPNGSGLKNGKVTFSATYKYNEASSARRGGSTRAAAPKKTYYATSAVAKKTSGGFIRTTTGGTTPDPSTTTPSTNPTTETVTVTFNSDGGSSVTAQTIDKDATATAPPTNPTKEGYTFKYWSLDGSTEYSFSTPVTADITLKAIWEQDTSSSGSGSGTTGGTSGSESGNTGNSGSTGNTTEKEVTLTVEVDVTVVPNSTPAKDAAGNKLYKNKDINQPATIADIAAGTQLYTAKETILYTGWQSIGGKSFYFKDDHTVVTGEQVIQGVKYNFGSDGALLPSGMGVDVSKWQGKIDWAALAPNISFAIIRCGYRGSSGGLSVDPQYARNMQQAKANGVRVGIYIYSKATNEAMAVEEASLAVQLAQEQGGVSLPIYIDIEDGSQKGLSKDELTAIANAFCATVANSGYRPGVYASYNWWNQRLNAGSINGSKWVARYNTQCGMACDIWQYSSKGTLPGIGGNVDVNQSYF